MYVLLICVPTLHLDPQSNSWSFMASCESMSPCVFLTKFLQVFGIWHVKTCTHKKMHFNWHAWFKIPHVVWLVKKKTITHQLTCLKLKRHVYLGMWHWGDILEKNVDVSWHSFYFTLKMSHDTLNLKLNVKWKLSNICIAMSALPIKEFAITHCDFDQAQNVSHAHLHWCHLLSSQYSDKEGFLKPYMILLLLLYVHNLAPSTRFYEGWVLVQDYHVLYSPGIYIYIYTHTPNRLASHVDTLSSKLMQRIWCGHLFL